MQKALYLNDSYLKECNAKVVSVKNGKFVVLDQTIFYPNSGGQLWDEGKIVKNGEEFKVVFVGKFDGKISHEVDKEGLQQGDSVHCIINWERRYKLMRMHTAAHLLSSIFYKESGAKISGNQLGLDKSRIDFTLENFDKEKIQQYVDKANYYIQQDLPVTISYMPRSEAEKNIDLARLTLGLPQGIETLRIVSIGEIDKQADGGTHVRSLKEIGRITLLKCENKGKNNRRVYFVVE